jgi:hypothetical protein
MFDDTGRTEHCFFARLCKDKGHCIAHCHHRNLVEPGITEDCIGKRSETTQDYLARIERDRKLH